jgi:hypothetical protein
MISGISSLGMMIPGAGMAIGGAGMIAGAIISGFEAAAEKDKEQKKKLEVQKLEAQIKEANIRVEKRTKFGDETLALMNTGLKLKDAAAAVVREQAQAGKLATKYQVAPVTVDGVTQTGAQVVDAIRGAFIQAGMGSEFAKDTEKSNKFLEAAVALSKATNITDPQQLADAVSNTFAKEGIAGLDRVIKDQTSLYTTGGPDSKNVVTTKPGRVDFQNIETNKAFAAAALDALNPKMDAFTKALTLGSQVGGTQLYGFTDALKAAGFDYSKLKTDNYGRPQYTSAELLAEVKRQQTELTGRIADMVEQSKTGIAKGQTTKIESSTTSPIIVKPVPMDEKTLPSYKQRALQLAEAQLQTAILQNMLKLDRNPKATDLTDLKPLENAVTRLRSEVGGSSNWSPAVP